MEKYEHFEDILRSWNLGVALVRDKCSGELFAVKYIARGEQIDEHVEREIMKHRSSNHPNIIRFKEVFLTPTHLAIVMEYVAGVERFERISDARRISEDEARFFFQQLISGLSYCHSMQIFYRDISLVNAWLDGSPVPRLKIWYFGYSKVVLCIISLNSNLNICLVHYVLHKFQSSVFLSDNKSNIGIAPEILLCKEYDGEIADVWSCGAALYAMLVGASPFEDPDDPRNYREIINRILRVHYSIPKHVSVSEECKHLFSQIFVADPEKRITIPEIKKHPWFLKNLPVEYMEGEAASMPVQNADDYTSQSVDDALAIIREARTPVEAPETSNVFVGGSVGNGGIE